MRVRDTEMGEMDKIAVVPLVNWDVVIKEEIAKFNCAMVAGQALLVLCSRISRLVHIIFLYLFIY